jgi:hypothetical protein
MLEDVALQVKKQQLPAAVCVLRGLGSKGSRGNASLVDLTPCCVREDACSRCESDDRRLLLKI